MTDVIIYKKIEATIIRPSKEHIWVEKEKAQAWPGIVCSDVSPEQVLLCPVKGGVGASDTLHRHCHLSLLMAQLWVDGEASG